MGKSKKVFTKDFGGYQVQANDEQGINGTIQEGLQERLEYMLDQCSKVTVVCLTVSMPDDANKDNFGKDIGGSMNVLRKTMNNNNIQTQGGMGAGDRAWKQPWARPCPHGHHGRRSAYSKRLWSCCSTEQAGHVQIGGQRRCKVCSLRYPGCRDLRPTGSEIQEIAIGNHHPKERAGSGRTSSECSELGQLPGEIGHQSRGGS